jgi:tetratricopeptide (TPR) repeat protein
MKFIAFIALLSSINLLAQRQVEKYYELAQQKRKAGEWNDVKSYINQCLNENPAFAEAYVLRGEANEHLDQQNDALTDYSIAIELAPQVLETYFNRGVLAYKLKRFDLAKTDFRKLLSFQNTETNMVYFRQSNNEGFDKIFTTQSGIRDMVYNYLGLMETESGEITNAILYFDSAIQISPRVPDFFAHRGLAHRKAGNLERAKKDFYQALQFDSEHAISKNNLASISKQEGNLTEAEKLLMEAKASNSKAANHYADLALIQLESGKFREAILNLDTAITLDGKDGELFINRGLAKEKANNWDGASHDFEMALKIDSEWPKAWFVQGNHFMKRKQWQQALENYTVAITFDENYAMAYYNRAIVKFQLGQSGEACQDIKVAEGKGMTVEQKMKDKFCGK